MINYFKELCLCKRYTARSIVDHATKAIKDRSIQIVVVCMVTDVVIVIDIEPDESIVAFISPVIGDCQNTCYV